jgi:D-ribose pyranose/furanose isomerase RbsD
MEAATSVEGPGLPAWLEAQKVSLSDVAAWLTEQGEMAMILACTEGHGTPEERQRIRLALQQQAHKGQAVMNALMRQVGHTRVAFAQRSVVTQRAGAAWSGVL